MSIKIKVNRQALVHITYILQPLYNNKATTRKGQTVLSIGLQVVAKLDRKLIQMKTADLFDVKKKATVSLLFFEADFLEAILLQEIPKEEDEYIRVIIQKVINELNQKLA